MKRRVLFVAPTAYLLSGLASWLDYVLPGLAKSGWDPVLGLVEGAGFHKPGPYLEVHPWPHHVVIPCMTGTRTGRQQAIRRSVRTLCPDLVASVNIPDVYPALAGMEDRRGIPRIVMTVHGISARLDQDARLYGHSLDGLIASNQLACRLAANAVPRERVFYAPYGVRVPPPEMMARKLPPDPLTILYAGRLDQSQKRVLDLPGIALTLARRGVRAAWRFAGDGPERQALTKAMASVVDPGSVTFLGVLAPDALKREYQQASVLLVTSEWETGPIVIWEAMAQGRPVVTSNYTGSGLEGALVSGRNCLQFPVGDVEGAAGCLARLATEKGLGEQLSATALALVRSRYSVDSSVACWTECLGKILELPARRHGATGVRPSLGSVTGPVERLKECWRRVAGARVDAQEPGGEWPSTHSPGASRVEKEFMCGARRLDGWEDTRA